MKLEKKISKGFSESSQKSLLRLGLEYDNIYTRIFRQNSKMKKVQQHLATMHKHGQKILTFDNFYIKVTFNLGNLEFITSVHAYLRLCEIYKSPYHCQ